MAVYTTLTESEIRGLLSHFDLPALWSFQGASSGVENTTYFLTLESGAQYVLTVFEYFSPQSLRPYIKLTTQLHQQRLPVPCPLVDRQGIVLHTTAGKPALLFTRAPGNHIESVDPPICQQVGSMLARIHLAIPNPEMFSLAQSCSLIWMKETLTLVKSSLDKSDINLLERQLELSADLQTRHLPRGIIHGDLFRDNVLIQDSVITAVIDFYNAGPDILLIDLAIAANDWCFTQKSSGNDCESALLDGYQMIRPLSEVEHSSWRDCLQVAAARLWLSRQKRLLMPQQGYERTIKDPGEYRSLLLYHLK